MPAKIDYDEFVVVAEHEMRCHSKTGAAFGLARFSIQLANIELECTFGKVWVIKNVAENLVTDELQFEVVIHGRREGELKHELLTASPVRTRLNEERSLCDYNRSDYSDHLWTLRMLKKRSEFPTFGVSDDFPVSNLMADLRVGSRVFQVEKKMLASISPYFDRMFNGKFVESKAEEIELQIAEFGNAHIFHDFLLTTLLSGDNTVLPNTQNIASLLRMADFYEVDTLRDKCVSYLKVCRELPLKERIFLCKEYGLKDVLRGKIVNEMSFEERKQLLNDLLDEWKF